MTVPTATEADRRTFCSSHSGEPDTKGGRTHSPDDGPGGQQILAATYPGVPGAVGIARHAVLDVLGGVPVAGDVVWCLGEIATNAVLHSRSGSDGGQFTVAVHTDHGRRVTVSVADQGGAWADPGYGDYLHGLQAVGHLADEVRIHGDDTGRTVTLIFAWGTR